MVKGEADARVGLADGRQRTVFLCWHREMALVRSRATFLTLIMARSDEEAPAAHKFLPRPAVSD